MKFELNRKNILIIAGALLVLILILWLALMPRGMEAQLRRQMDVEAVSGVSATVYELGYTEHTEHSFTTADMEKIRAIYDAVGSLQYGKGKPGKIGGALTYVTISFNTGAKTVEVILYGDEAASVVTSSIVRTYHLTNKADLAPILALLK